jgi:hypothetical protein
MAITQSNGEKQSGSVNVTNEDDLRLVIVEGGTSSNPVPDRRGPYNIRFGYSCNCLDLLVNIPQTS